MRNCKIAVAGTGCEDYISAESLVECIHGLPVKSIEFFTAENQRKEA